MFFSIIEKMKLLEDFLKFEFVRTDSTGNDTMENVTKSLEQNERSSEQNKNEKQKLEEILFEFQILRKNCIWA